MIGHDRRMVEPPATPHRERWLQVVPDDGSEVPPAAPDPTPEEGSGSDSGVGGQVDPQHVKPTAIGQGAGIAGRDPTARQPAPDSGVECVLARRRSRPRDLPGLAEGGSAGRRPEGRGLDGASTPLSVQMRPSESDSGRTDGHGSAAVPRAASSRVVWAWAGAGAGAGTAAATVADRVVGGLDGRPALFLLVVLALPFWDGLPARFGIRLAELAAVGAAVAVLWFGLAMLRPEGWWRAEIAYGIACGIAGTAHALLSRRRTVGP